MRDTHTAIYKGHEIVVTLTEDTARYWTFVAQIDGKNLAIEAILEFPTKDEALKFALTFCEYRIDNPKITLDSTETG